MHDIKWIRDSPDAFDQALQRRSLPPIAQNLLHLDKEYRQAQTKLQELNTRRNEISKKIGEMKQAKQDTAQLEREASEAVLHETELKQNLERWRQEMEDVLATLPNMPAADVPEGRDEKANKELRKVGEPKRKNNSKEHFDIGEVMGLMDFESAAKLSGSRFVVLKGQLARLERALANFMLDIHTGEFGYTEISPPLLVKTETMFGTGQLPKFREDQFETTHGMWLVPTSEVPLTNLARESILNVEDLPLRYTAATPCFRAEAGAAGKDTRGMLRQHQFTKVELVSITHPDKSVEEHERMTECAETVLKRLGLPFRTVLLCTGDMGFSARKTYDIEVWLPGQNTYREISSCSNCGDFQARRMQARFRAKGEKATQFVHTLNGSGVAVGRCLIAILENYQQDNGSVLIPEKLRPYMNNAERIESPTKNAG